VYVADGRTDRQADGQKLLIAPFSTVGGRCCGDVVLMQMQILYQNNYNYCNTVTMTTAAAAAATTTAAALPPPPPIHPITPPSLSSISSQPSLPRLPVYL